jgi:HAMP domain-containing protein
MENTPISKSHANFFSKLGIKVTLKVNFLVLIVVGIGTYILITQQISRYEDEILNKGQLQSLVGAKMIGTIIEETIDNGVLTVSDFFDTQYEEVGNFVPPKYHTRFDTYLDKAILDLQDEFLKDDCVVFAAAVDRNGYLPTHNSPFQQQYTGNPEKDKIGNQTKRVFNDPIGLKAARNTTPGLLQIYPTENGEILWDVSSPVQVKGRHWGGFRIGMSLAKIEKAKKELALTILGIMASILLASFLLIFIIFNRSIASVRVLSDTANGLAKGQHLLDEVTVTEKNEIGELQQALECMRLSMVIALKQRKKSRDAQF